jgi:hypothetical protein
LGLALMGVCAVFVRIAAEQGGKVGIFVLAAIFCVFVICPVLWMGLT